MFMCTNSVKGLADGVLRSRTRQCGDASTAGRRDDRGARKPLGVNRNAVVAATESAGATEE